MNPLAWWIDYYVGAVSTHATRLELWGFLLLHQPNVDGHHHDQPYG